MKPRLSLVTGWDRELQPRLQGGYVRFAHPLGRLESVVKAKAKPEENIYFIYNPLSHPRCQRRKSITSLIAKKSTNTQLVHNAVYFEPAIDIRPIRDSKTGRGIPSQLFGQFRNGNPKRFGNLFNVPQGNVPLTSFDRSHVGSIQFALGCKPLLRKPHLQTELPHPRTESF